MPPIYRHWSREDLDREYNNRARVDDFQAIVDDWNERSRRFRGWAAAHRDLAYGEHPRERLDVFPARKPLAPVQVFFHGGYWQALDKNVFSFVAEGFHKAGFTSVLVNYPLAPDDDMDRIVESCRQSVQWVRRHIHTMHGDPEQLFVSGHSAGGHIVAELMATDWKQAFPGSAAVAIRGGISLSGIFDLEPIRLCYLNEVIGMGAEMARRHSPMFMHPVARSPLILAVGARESESYQLQSRELKEIWPSEGCPVTLQVVGGADHFSILEHLVNADSTLFRAAAAQAVGQPGF
jgi:arylformamidase